MLGEVIIKTNFPKFENALGHNGNTALLASIQREMLTNFDTYNLVLEFVTRTDADHLTQIQINGIDPNGLQRMIDTLTQCKTALIQYTKQKLEKEIELNKKHLSELSK